MGNKILIPGSLSSDLNENNELGKFIKDWALNDYTVHPDLDPKTPLYIDQLKKRACGTNNPKPGIGLPGIDDDNNFVPHYNVTIPVFDEINETNCRLPYNYLKKDDYLHNGDQSKSTDGNYMFSSVDGEFLLISQEGRDFYNSFCAAVKKNRTQYDKPTADGKPNLDLLYGPDPDPTQPNHIENSYSDCNCANSLFKDKRFFNPPSSGKSIPLDGLAQQLDIRCNTNMNRHYITDHTPESCLNYMNFGSINISKDSKAQITQTCKMADGSTPQTITDPTTTNAPSSGTTNAPPSGTTNAPPSGTANAPPSGTANAPSEKNWYSKLTKNQKILFWIGVVIIIIIIIVALINAFSDSNDSTNSDTSDTSADSG